MLLAARDRFGQYAGAVFATVGYCSPRPAWPATVRAVISARANEGGDSEVTLGHGCQDRGITLTCARQVPFPPIKPHRAPGRDEQHATATTVQYC